MLANTPAHPDGAGRGCGAGSEVVNKAEGVSGNPERPLSKHPVRWFDGVVQFGEQGLFSGPAFMPNPQTTSGWRGMPPAGLRPKLCEEILEPVASIHTHEGIVWAWAL